MTGTPAPRRSSATIALGAFLLLAVVALVGVLIAGDAAPLWMIGAWFLLAAAIALIVGAWVPTGEPRERRGPRGSREPAAPREPRRSREPRAPRERRSRRGR